MSTSKNTNEPFYSIKYHDVLVSSEATITFYQPFPAEFLKHDYDWYIIVALEIANRVTDKREMLTKDFILAFRWAIREGYQKGYDPQLTNKWAFPRIRKTIEGIERYIERIKQASGFTEKSSSD